jgi:GntR family histidine utilization transcriptional repressor
MNPPRPPAAETTLPKGAAPLYLRVKRYVLDAIDRGAWSAAKRLPSEAELVRELGVSRMTVNRALRELATEGRLTRVPGVGSFVAPPPRRAPLVEIADIAVEIAARGGVHAAEVRALDVVAPDAALVAAFEFAAPAPVGHSVIVHSEDGAPVQIEERWVNLSVAPDYCAQDFTCVTTYAYLQSLVPVTEVEHVISAVPAAPDAASLLGLPAGAPCLLLRRRTFTGATVVTVNRLTYAGARVALASRYAPAAFSGR